jgi:hypothetical protein
MSAAVFELVVTGRLGPSLRSRLGDLDIRDRPPRTCLVLRADQSALLSVIAAITAGQGNNDQRRINAIRILPDDMTRTTPATTTADLDPPARTISRPPRARIRSQ